MMDVMSTVQRIGTEPDPAQRLRDAWAESLADHMSHWVDPDNGDKGMSRKRLQRLLEDRHGVEVSLQAISLWMTAQTAPKPTHQVAIASVLGVPARRLFPLEAAA